jgi:hypothetical protein
MKSSSVVRHWHSACIVSDRALSRARVEVRMKFKLIAAILGLMIAVPGAVVAQNSDDQAPDQDSKPSPSIRMPGPNDQGPVGEDSTDQGSMNQGSTDPGSNDSGPGAPTSSAPAPAETRGVARISLIHGDVSTQRGDSKDWSAAALNAPVFAGDRVSTGDKARTELQLDYANMLRLAEHTQANITQLTRSQIQIQLGHGMANYSVYKNSDADTEIDTPNVAIRTERRESSFRILVTADDHTEVLVRSGEVEVTTPQGGTRVGQGQFITIQGVGDQAQYKIGEAPARDDWDQWNTDRDNMIRSSVSRRETNDYYVGTEDLDAHGTWTEVPDYGPVWRPTEPAGWAPYRAGRWVYEPYWGWTWVSYDSWGWAPYHYGRWMYADGGWGWWPGPAYGYPFYRPIWAPAYVSFLGFGGGFGFGLGFGWGSVGWLPLGPGDFFHPWWGRWGGRYGGGGFGGYNRGGFAPLRAGSRFSNVNLAMHNANFRGGTTVSGRDFGSGRMNAQPMTHAQFQNAHFATGRLPVTPSRESFSASGRPAAASTTRNVSQNQHFFSARGTAGAASGRSAETGREGGGARPGYSGASTTARENGGGNGGWQRFSPMAPRSSSPSESGRAGQSPARTEDRGSSRGYGSGAYGSGGYGSSGHSSGGYSRPPLNMRQPIVRQRSYGGGAYGGGRSAPSYGGGRTAPSYGGGRSAPSSRGGGSSHGGGSHGGGSHGGGSSHGGGGGRHGR